MCGEEDLLAMRISADGMKVEEVVGWIGWFLQFLFPGLYQRRVACFWLFFSRSLDV
jgi:hypothetical protein